MVLWSVIRRPKSAGYRAIVESKTNDNETHTIEKSKAIKSRWILTAHCAEQFENRGGCMYYWHRACRTKASTETAYAVRVIALSCRFYVVYIVRKQCDPVKLLCETLCKMANHIRTHIMHKRGLVAFDTLMSKPVDHFHWFHWRARAPADGHLLFASPL